MRARVHDQRAAHAQRQRQCVVRVATEDHVQPLDAVGELGVHGQAVVAEQHHQPDLALLAQLGHERLQRVLADAEGQVGHEPSRMGDRHVGKRLADDADGDPADLANGVRPEDPVAPARLGHVVRDEVAGELPAALTVTEQLGRRMDRHP